MRLWVSPTLWICLLLIAASTARAQQMLNDVTATVLPLPANASGDSTSHGYLEIRVALTNHSESRTRQVTLTVPADWYGDGIHAVSRTVKLAPNITNTVVSLFQPPMPMSGDGLKLTVDGQSMRVPMNLPGHAGVSYSSMRSMAAMIDSSLADAVGKISDSKGRSMNLASHRSELPVEQWSGQWLGYTRFDVVMLRDAQMQRMPVEVAEALRRYVQAGGILVVVGQGWQIPAGWGLQQTGSRHELPTTYVGLGEVMRFNDEKALIAAADELLMQIHQVAGTWENRPDLNNASSRLPVIEKLSIPVRGLLALIVLFAVVIGPVNLWLLGRKRRRMWLLWTVPLISILTCGAIWSYSLLAEGWRGQTRTRTLTLLDQQNFTSATIGWVGYYAPLTPADGLRFSADTEVTPLLDRSYGYGRYGHSIRPCTVELTEDQHLDSGWVVARVPAYFMLRNTASSVRPRLIFSDNGGSITVTNGLGINLTQLIYVDSAGSVHKLTASLPAGQKTTLVHEQGKTKILRMERLHELAVGNWMDSFDRLNLSVTGRDPLKSGIRPLGPGMYLAVSDQASPFLEPGLKNLRKQQHETYIIGITAPGSMPPATADVGTDE